MNGRSKLVVVVLVLVAVAGALALKRSGDQGLAARSDVTYDPSAPVPLEPVPESYDASEAGLPRLVALGAGACIPCRAMAPIRAELRREYAGQIEVDFYDVWKDGKAGAHFHVQAIPTLIYYDAVGRELGRQYGYVPKDAILANLDRFGMGVAGGGG